MFNLNYFISRKKIVKKKKKSTEVLSLIERIDKVISYVLLRKDIYTHKMDFESKGEPYFLSLTTHIIPLFRKLVNPSTYFSKIKSKFVISA